MARFCSLFSSSSGNCTYIGSGGGGILVDAGVSAKQINNKLNCIGVGIEGIGAIFVTHEHSDHITGLRTLASRHGIPVYATEGTVAALSRSGVWDGSFTCEAVSYDGIEACGQYVKPFRTSHDAAESCGYVVTTTDGRRLAVMTDSGVVTEEMRRSVTGCDLILAESNHDVGMLRNGAYPYMLKRRILSEKGHLSNDSCAELITGLVTGGTTRIYLGHLSRQNNIPELAFQTSKSSLDCAGAVENRDYILKVAGFGEPVMAVL